MCLDLVADDPSLQEVHHDEKNNKTLKSLNKSLNVLGDSS